MAYGQLYPMKRRKWPIVLGAILVLLVMGCVGAVYNITTQTPLYTPPTPAPTTTVRSGEGGN